MDRTVLFRLASAAAVICLLIAIVYWIGGTPLGHHTKHGILFFGLAVIAGLFAAVNRPTRSLI